MVSPLLRPGLPIQGPSDLVSLMVPVVPIKLTESDKTRFWSWVDISEADACWEWQGAKGGGESSGKKYGAFKIAENTYRASRVAFVIANGDTEFQVLHSCNNPSCCNPAHLYAGTQRRNIQQAIQEGRFDNRGEKCGKATLSNSDVREIRALYADNHTQRSIAELYGISRAQVSRICSGKQWKHL